MVVTLLAKSPAISIVSDESDESGAHKTFIRVLDEKLWFRLLPDLLKAANSEPEFGLEAHKVFHLDAANDMVFTWLVVHWGDPAAVLGKIHAVMERKAPVLPPAFAVGRRAATPAPAPFVPVPTQKVAARPAPQDDEGPDLPDVVLGQQKEGEHRIRFSRTLENGTEEYKIPLPHVRKNRYEGNPHEVVTLESGRGRFKAVAQGRGEAEFSYRKAENL